jgi:hypothetical protein
VVGHVGSSHFVRTAFCACALRTAAIQSGSSVEVYRHLERTYQLFALLRLRRILRAGSGGVRSGRVCAARG